jgi:hypothetical protein
VEPNTLRLDAGAHETVALAVTPGDGAGAAFAIRAEDPHTRERFFSDIMVAQLTPHGDLEILFADEAEEVPGLQPA